jgi:hypothetical protein
MRVVQLAVLWTSYRCSGQKGLVRFSRVVVDERLLVGVAAVCAVALWA